jgi:uncharacterized protein (DUF2225 family)
MASESPVFLSKVECPICKTINEFETIRVGAYTESGRDTDFCPTGRQWRNPRYQAYNPLLYFIATCDNCYYTREFTNNFKEWKEDSNFKTYRLKTVKEKHLDHLAQADSALRIIGEVIDANRYPNETAILKFLLAIYDERLNEKPVDLDLARFYLRVGWIFREMGTGGDPNQQVVKGYLTDIDDNFTSLHGSLETVNEQLLRLDKLIASQFDDNKISAELKSHLYPLKDKHDNEAKSLRELLSLVDGKIDALEDISNEYKKMALGTADGDVQAGFQKYRSFSDFLMELRPRWDGIPINELEALKMAVKHYKTAYEEGRDISEGNQQIQAAYLIAELSRRIGDYQMAREYFNITIRSGQEFIYRHKGDQNRTAMARKILELAMEQGRANLAEAKTA